jgi:O-antigen ligase
MAAGVTMAKTSVRYSTARPAVARPGPVERTLVILTTFVLLHPLPIAWFQTRAQFVEQDGNFTLLAVQLMLMLMAVARVVGDLDWWLLAYRLDQTLFAFVGLAFATFFWSADPGATLRQAIMFGAVTLYGVYLVLRFPLVEILQLFAVMFVISAVVNLAFVIAMPAYAIDNGLWDGVFFQKNALGFSALIGIPTLIVAGRTNARARFVFYGTVLVLFVLLLGSQSKTMLVATLASVLLLFIFRLFRGRRTLRGAVLLSLAAMSVLTVAVATANIAVLAEWLDKDITLTGRIPLWESLIPVVVERPLTGWGYRATFGDYFSPVHEVLVQADWKPTHAHNAALQIWLEMGVFGVLLFLITYIRAVARSLQVVNIVPGIVGLWPLMFLSSTLLISITESGISYSRPGWLLYVVAVLSVAHVVRTPRSAPAGGTGGGRSFRVGAVAGAADDISIGPASTVTGSSGRGETADLGDLLDAQPPS